MKFTIAAVVALAAGANAWGNETVYTTEVVTALTTYCPAPTTITHGDKTYTVTKATTLTITDCPCTISKPVTTSTYVVCHTCTANSTVTPTKPPVTTSANPTKPPTVTAGAGKVAALSGAALAAVMGVAALL